MPSPTIASGSWESWSCHRSSISSSVDRQIGSSHSKRRSQSHYSVMSYAILRSSMRRLRCYRLLLYWVPLNLKLHRLHYSRAKNASPVASRYLQKDSRLLRGTKRFPGASNPDFPFFVCSPPWWYGRIFPTSSRGCRGSLSTFLHCSPKSINK